MILVKGGNTKLKDIYRPDPVTISIGDDLTAAARRMEEAQVGALAVVDEAGQLVGIFTERDLVRATARAINPASVLVSAHASFRPETAKLGGGLPGRRPAHAGAGGPAPPGHRRRGPAGRDGLHARCAGGRGLDVGRLHGCDPSNRSGAPGAAGRRTVRLGVPAHPSRRTRGAAGPDQVEEPAGGGNRGAPGRRREGADHQAGAGAVAAAAGRRPVLAVPERRPLLRAGAQPEPDPAAGGHPRPAGRGRAARGPAGGSGPAPGRGGPEAAAAVCRRPGRHGRQGDLPRPRVRWRRSTGAGAPVLPKGRPSAA
jgi:CBS domain-containing protein